LLEDQMVESVPQVKFEKEDGFLAIMDAVKARKYFVMAPPATLSVVIAK